MKYCAILCFATFIAGRVAVPFGECPSVDGVRPVHLPDIIKRNVFWECNSGKPIELVCPSGLIHNPSSDVRLGCLHHFRIIQSFGCVISPEDTTRDVTFAIQHKGNAAVCSDGIRHRDYTSVCCLI